MTSSRCSYLIFSTPQCPYGSFGLKIRFDFVLHFQKTIQSPQRTLLANIALGSTPVMLEEIFQDDSRPRSSWPFSHSSLWEAIIESGNLEWLSFTKAERHAESLFQGRDAPFPTKRLP